MKNITRRGFLQLTAATALVCATAPLTGCGKKNIKKLVLGDWYMEGYSRLEYAIYDDGSCQVRSGYGLGKWSVVDDDKLRISDFYGQTLIYKIEKISKKSTSLTSFDQKVNRASKSVKNKYCSIDEKKLLEVSDDI